MKLKYIVIGGFIGVILSIIGALLTILHLPGATITSIIGVAIENIMLVLGLIKVLTHKRFKDILNT